MVDADEVSVATATAAPVKSVGGGASSTAVVAVVAARDLRCRWYRCTMAGFSNVVVRSVEEDDAVVTVACMEGGPPPPVNIVGGGDGAANNDDDDDNPSLAKVGGSDGISGETIHAAKFRVARGGDSPGGRNRDSNGLLVVVVVVVVLLLQVGTTATGDEGANS